MNKCKCAVSYFDSQGFLSLFKPLMTATAPASPSPRSDRRHRLRACQHVRGRSSRRIQFLWLFGGRSSRRSLVAVLDQSACYGNGDRCSANQIPRQEERGLRHVTTPPGQSMDLPLVLANDRVTSSSARQNHPVRESRQGGGVPPPLGRQGE